MLTYRYYYVNSRGVPLPDSVIFILRFTAFALIHSIGATSRFKKIISGDSLQEPGWYRLAYNTVSFILFLYVMAAYRSSRVLYFVPGIWSLVMYLAQLVVAGILIQCVTQTGAADFFGLRQLRSEPRSPVLYTGGWYRFVRHPLYLFSLLLMLLNPVMSVQWLLLTVSSFVYFMIGAQIEEKRLVQQFGEKYRHYQQATPFLFPGLKRCRTITPYFY